MLSNTQCLKVLIFCLQQYTMGENARGVRCRENDYPARSVVTRMLKVKGHCALPQVIQDRLWTK